MTTADRAAVDALARHFAYEGGGFWEHLDPREQATYRARALDVVQVVGPIYQPSTFAAPCVICGAVTSGTGNVDGVTRPVCPSCPVTRNKVAALAPIEERRTMADSARRIFADHAKVLDSFSRPMSKEPTK